MMIGRHADKFQHTRIALLVLLSRRQVWNVGTAACLVSEERNGTSRHGGRRGTGMGMSEIARGRRSRRMSEFFRE